MAENNAVFAETVAAELFPDDEVIIAGGTGRTLGIFDADRRFDAVLVDFDLDDGPGIDLVGELRTNRYEGVIVAISANDDSNALLVAAGADVACNKLEFRALRPMLRTLLDPLDFGGGPLDRAIASLEGLSVGDAFGQRFFGPDDWAKEQVTARRLPPSTWITTDDTEMATAIVDVLAEHGHIHASALARAFVRRYAAEPNRGYGGGASRLLQRIRDGAAWSEASRELFGGAGSMGNGGAMRVAPIGAYFADDLLSVIREARVSAAVTHAHIEGQAGAVAVAAAAAWACRERAGSNPAGLLPFAQRLCPPGPTHDGLRLAQRLPAATTPTEAAELLGSGARLLSSDTVPFALWCASRHLDDFEAALWAAVEGLGDRDTTCAMVGGIVAAVAPPPSRWVQSREPLRFEMRKKIEQRPPSLGERAERWAWATRARARGCTPTRRSP